MPTMMLDDETGPGMDALGSEAIAPCSAGAPGGLHGLHPR